MDESWNKKTHFKTKACFSSSSHSFLFQFMIQCSSLWHKCYMNSVCYEWMLHQNSSLLPFLLFLSIVRKAVSPESFWQIDQFDQPLTHSRTHYMWPRTWADFIYKQPNSFTSFFILVVPVCVFYVSCFVSLVYGYISGEVSHWRKSIHISFHDCRNARNDKRGNGEGSGAWL